MMQKTGIFVNISRGDVVDEHALIDALQQGRIAGAGLDVYEFEPKVPVALMAMENVTLLPHLGIPGTFHEDMCENASQHWLALAAIAPEKVRRILEIGTFSGDTSAFLSALFPHAQIVTCDLPDDSPRYIASYGRQNAEKKLALEKKRQQNLAAENITFIQKNSFLLPGYISGPFDIIWMDGGHTYPDVAFDLCNAWHMLADDGILLCDDIYIPQQSDAAKNYDSYHVFAPLIQDNIIDVNYMAKRLCAAPSLELDGKMIAAVKKIPQPPL